MFTTVQGSGKGRSLRRRYDRDWDQLARTEPLYAVLTNERYLTSRLTPEDESGFWRSGEACVEEVAGLFRAHLGCALEPLRALDFGCGVGRLLLPIAQRSQTAVGVDVSPTMLSLAASACERAGLANVSLAASLPANESFDFVNALLVFQHIPVRLGLDLLDTILGALTLNGLLALQLLFSRPHDTLPYRLGRSLYVNAQPIHGLVNLLRGMPGHAPYMQMNAYPMDEVLLRFARHGIGDIHLGLTDDHGFKSALVVARKVGEEA